MNDKLQDAYISQITLYNEYINKVSLLIREILKDFGLDADVVNEYGKKGVFRVYKPAREPLSNFILAFFPYRDRKEVKDGTRLWISPESRYRLCLSETKTLKDVENEIKSALKKYSKA